MDPTTLRTFAQGARRQLMAAVTGKLNAALAARTPDYLATFAPQVAKLRLMAEDDRSGLIERVAYTWFNRLAALRFMDARGWHPFHARVLTPVSASEIQPELLKVTRSGALPEELRIHTDPARINDLLDGRIPSSDAQGEVYRHLVLAACHFYHDLLPDLFETLDDETELLLPDDLLTAHSVVQGFRTEITDEDCGDGERANVEILGWLYQFYISERKDEVMARKSAVPTEDIPAVTQLFTPHWIVRYLIENSLGRLWMLNRPGSKLREHMPYYIEGDLETNFLKISRPEELRLLDPAVGSGHMLTYAFDLLTLIYEEEGYASTEIPAVILRNNLYGLDICPRATQLAELALAFKARDKFRRFFQSEHLVQPQILELRDVRFAETELQDYAHALGLGNLLNQSMLTLLHQFEEAKNFGSLIQPCLDERAIASARRAIAAKDLGGQLFLRETHLKVLRVLEQAEALSQRYHVVVANPPYMGSGAMNQRLKDFVGAHWEDGKSDSYAAFMVRNLAMTLPSGHVAMITIPNWMFLRGFEALRRRLIGQTDFASLVHCGRGIWGSDFGSCAFVLKAGHTPDFRGNFKRLFKQQGEVQSTSDIQENFFNVGEFPTYSSTSSDFTLIPGCPIAYWLSPRWRACFGKETFGDHLLSEGAVKTGNNSKFIRYIWELASLSVGANRHWRKHPKGGPFRRWFGNLEYVVDWSEEARRHYRDDHIARIPVESIWNMTGITWTAVSIGELSFRVKAEDEIANNAALFVYARRPETLLAHLCCLNSCVTRHFLGVVSPAVNFLVGDVLAIPFPSKHEFLDIAPRIGEQTVSLSKADWDNFETSWDFHDQPLLRPGLKGATLAGC